MVFLLIIDVKNNNFGTKSNSSIEHNLLVINSQINLWINPICYYSTVHSNPIWFHGWSDSVWWSVMHSSNCFKFFSVNFSYSFFNDSFPSKQENLLLLSFVLLLLLSFVLSLLFPFNFLFFIFYQIDNKHITYKIRWIPICKHVMKFVEFLDKLLNETEIAISSIILLLQRRMCLTAHCSVAEMTCTHEIWREPSEEWKRVRNLVEFEQTMSKPCLKLS